MNYQEQVLTFWAAENRALAVFEGQTIGPEHIKADGALAERYWKRQLAACHHNWTLRGSR
ncbi:MAG: hypothetical protein ABFE07_29260 [Armatimonadia bacterium]